MIKVILKDGSTMEIEEGTSILEVAKRISEGLARNVTCGEINGEIRDIRYKIKEDCNLILHTFKMMIWKEKKLIGIQRHILWHKL